MKKKIAIFASGEGTNTQRIIDYFKNSETIEIAIVVCNNPKANVLKRAAQSNIATYILNREDFYERNTTAELLKMKKIDLIVLAGFLWMIPENLIKAFPEKIINIHPALLPKFGGKGMYGANVHKAVIEAKEKESGISIHIVNEKYDEGKIISQHTCLISEKETPETLAQKIHQLEQIYFPIAIEKFLAEK
jgi:phosphoribosylglycinamide formyltransferase-1